VTPAVHRKALPSPGTAAALERLGFMAPVLRSTMDEQLVADLKARPEAVSKVVTISVIMRAERD
jgi:hypothetical protein